MEEEAAAVEEEETAVEEEAERVAGYGRYARQCHACDPLDEDSERRGNAMQDKRGPVRNYKRKYRRAG